MGKSNIDVHSDIEAAEQPRLKKWPTMISLRSRCGSIPDPGSRGKLRAGAIGAAEQVWLEGVVLVRTARLPFLPGLSPGGDTNDVIASD